MSVFEAIRTYVASVPRRLPLALYGLALPMPYRRGGPSMGWPWWCIGHPRDVVEGRSRPCPAGRAGFGRALGWVGVLHATPEGWALRGMSCEPLPFSFALCPYGLGLATPARQWGAGALSQRALDRRHVRLARIWGGVVPCPVCSSAMLSGMGGYMRGFRERRNAASESGFSGLCHGWPMVGESAGYAAIGKP